MKYCRIASIYVVLGVALFMFAEPAIAAAPEGAGSTLKSS